MTALQTAVADYPFLRAAPAVPCEVTERERELAAIIRAYNDVTERLKGSHERLLSEVSRLHEELADKNAELRRRERLAALGQMAAGLAHEVRNPLGGIALYASMLESDLSDRPQSRLAAGKITAAVRTLDRLVSDILDFAQEDRLERRWCRLGDILTCVRDSCHAWAAEYGVEVQYDENAYGVALSCDPDRMQQVLVNLVTNAIQAAGRGGLVRLSARQIEADEGMQIEVSDSGPGIPPEDLDRIFNPFFTTRSTGTGLGLAIVHRIVEAHGATIRVENRVEGGATFTVSLPAGKLKVES